MQKDRNQIKCKVCGEIFLQEDLIKEDREDQSRRERDYRTPCCHEIVLIAIEKSQYFS
jgi:hypothetical protein